MCVARAPGLRPEGSIGKLSLEIELVSLTETPGGVVMRGQVSRGIVWNTLGQLAPLVGALLAIPVLIEAMGTTRFSVLTLAWALVAYFVVFDFGLGRATTKLVAERIGTELNYEIPRLVWTAIVMMGVLGVLGGVTLALLAELWATLSLTIPENLRDETVSSLRVLALGVPFLTGMVGLRGVLEAYQRFDITNAIRGPFGFLNYVAPLVALPFSNSLVAVITVIVLVRVGSFALHFVAVIRVVPRMTRHATFDLRMIRPLVSFGSWMALASITTPLLLTLDRFIIPSVMSIGVIAYYTVPYEVITKLWLFPAAILGVIFPVFSSTHNTDPQRALNLYKKATTATFIVMFPASLLIVCLALGGLETWLGNGFAAESYRVLQILAAGVLVNSMAYAPYGLLQGAGRPDLIAKLLLCELPIYVLLVWQMTVHYGLVGAAVAWFCRVTVDTILFQLIARRFLRTEKFDPGGVILIGVTSAMAVLLYGFLPSSFKGVWLLTLTGGYCWFLIRSKNAKDFSNIIRRWLIMAVGTRG